MTDRLAPAPMENHWWQVALFLTPRGLTTSPMPHGNRTFAVNFDFVGHELTVMASDGAGGVLPLIPRSVADSTRHMLPCSPRSSFR